MSHVDAFFLILVEDSDLISYSVRKFIVLYFSAFHRVYSCKRYSSCRSSDTPSACPTVGSAAQRCGRSPPSCGRRLAHSRASSGSVDQQAVLKLCSDHFKKQCSKKPGIPLIVSCLRLPSTRCPRSPLGLWLRSRIQTSRLSSPGALSPR